MFTWKSSIIKALQPPLPGERAQNLMAPSVRFTGSEPVNRQNARLSSVLILIYPTHLNIVVPFMQRPNYKGAHGGQISLPGGKCEGYDGSFWETALRETREELGIDTSNVEYMGELSMIYVHNSNYYVSPQVGFLPSRPVYNPNHFEVSEIFEVSVREFFLPQNVKKFSKTENGFNLEAPYFDAKGRQIWGATAMILSEFIEAFRQKAPDWLNALHSCNVHISQESL